jgi:ligand-binding sensor domain-containing protein
MDNRIIPPDEVEIVQPKRGTWQTYDVTDGLSGGVKCLLQDQHGYLWLGTGAGLCRYDGTEFVTYTTADGLADNRIMVICEDRQGRLWLGIGMSILAEGRGVSCFDGQRFITYTTADGLADNNVMDICEDRQGRLWFGTRGGATCFDGRNFTTYTIADGLAGNCVDTIREDRQGRLWFGVLDPFSTSGRGVTCFDGQNFTTYRKTKSSVLHTADDGLAHNDVLAICEDRQGRLWFGTRGGATCFDGRNFTTYTIADGLADNWINVIYEDHEGRLWFGTWGSGVCCFDGQRFLTYTTDDGLLTNRVDGIIQDGEGIFWFAHALNGLTRFDPEALQFLTDEPVSEILIQDKQGRLWFSNERELCSLRSPTPSRFSGQVRLMSSPPTEAVLWVHFVHRRLRLTVVFLTDDCVVKPLMPAYTAFWKIPEGASG